MKKTAALLMALVLVFALAACGKKTETAATDANATASQEITLQATNWKFDQPEYKVKKGEPLKINLDIKEGVHGVSIPDLKVSLDNNSKSKVVTPEKAGSYNIICSIPCGSGHSTMTAKLVVE